MLALALTGLLILAACGETNLTATTADPASVTTGDSVVNDIATTVAQTASKLGRNLWLLRFTMIAMSIAGVAVGVGLVVTSRFVEFHLANSPRALPARSADD